MRSPRLFQQFARESLEEPIRSEVFGVERLEQHAESLARAQRVTGQVVRGRPLMQRVEDNGRVLRAAHTRIAEAVREEQWITPAAAWLVDNFYVADEQLREIRDDLPAGFYRELPKLADGPLAGYPRVYGIAWAFVAHTDSRFDPDALRRFVQAYQRVQALTIGELWAITITLRVVLVENLRRCADAMVHARAARLEADALADELLGLGGTPSKSTATALQRFEDAPLAVPFAVELVHRLRDRDPAVTPALLWLRERLAAQGTTPDGVVAQEHQRQAAMTVTVRNVITSMRSLSALDWSEFFESVSLVDEALRNDVTFVRMDFESRDGYRHAIEELARGSRFTELDIAREAVQRAEWAKQTSTDTDEQTNHRRAETGYYLVGEGRRRFEGELAFRPTSLRRLQRAVVAAGAPGYIGSLVAVTAFLVAMPLVASSEMSVSGVGLLLLGILSAIPASDLAVAIVNRAITGLIAPSLLSRLELKGGVPPDLRTIVVVPTLLTSPSDVEEHIERLEVHYLANSDGDVRFALLSDWLDSPTEHASSDDVLLTAARDGIDRLNQRHGPAPDGSERFLLYHRRRLWNDRQRSWMGWERKRGKLHEFNRLLRGAGDTTYLPTGRRAVTVPPDVRFVLTLDSDTRLPIGAVSRLVGTMAHPLNRPRLDTRRKRVVDGYGVLQPRVTPPLPGRSGSLFQHLSSGPSGIDPYASAVSDVYQDLFDEGSFTGKGIYDVDAFEAALEGRIAENSLLSHDLFEGVFARSGLVTDVELFESAPSNYAAAAARQHRWARGDWQLLPMILRAAIPPVGRWKMLDNLRRTLSAPAAFTTLVVAWTWPFASPLIWNRFILVTLTLPVFLPVLGDLVPRVRGISKRSHARAVGRDLMLAVWQTSFAITMLAHQAWLMGDAILRTLVRLALTRRRLLEWVTSAQAKSRLPSNLSGFYRRMAGAVVLVTAAAAAVIWRGGSAIVAAAPLLLLWTLSPAIAYWISAPRLAARTSTLSPEDARTLRLIARRTWRFFTTFVGTEDRALPPDNYQEDPVGTVAHRTSPTNIGLYLLSVVAARDFGWIGTLDAVDRLEATLGSMKSVERFRGHFYNWYDSKEGRPLDPQYVSSVDSGNLAGSLLALANAARELRARPPLGGVALAGLDDTVQLLRESTLSVTSDRHARPDGVEGLDHALEAVSGALRQTPRDWLNYAAQLDGVERAVARAAELLPQPSPSGRDQADPEVAYWAGALIADVESRGRDLATIIPWARYRSAQTDSVMQSLATCPTLVLLPGRCAAVAEQLSALRARQVADGVGELELRNGLDALIGQVEHSAAAAEALMRRLEAVAQDADAMVQAMDFGFLFDPTRQLFSLGYRSADDSLDPGRYDLLASEARILSFVAIAKGDVPVSHWFSLGRPLTPAGNDSALLSWSGSMFEYLMPALLMRTPVGSLLEQTCRLIVSRQIDYGAERGVPWGVSESGYYMRDVAMTYQYSNFGVPGVGLRRGLGDDLVIAPYATALAAMIDPVAAVKNFGVLRSAGASGAYGFYEALDYTPARLPAGRPFAIVRSYMAHHQGMALVAIANALDDGVMRARFHAEPMVRATELLLQERTPRDVAVARPHAEDFAVVSDVREHVPPLARRFTSPHASTPRTHLLSNGRYAVMLTSAGSGYSRWQDLAVTRWREDPTRDDAGSYFYIRDAESGEHWSAGFQPCGGEPDAYEVRFFEDRAEFTRQDGAIATRIDVIVSSEDDAEVRRVSLTNGGSRIREIDVTSYAEVVLAPHASDVAHPAFSNLFVHTESMPEAEAVLATRRPRAPDEPQVWLAHVVAVEGETVGDLQWETDRSRFLGRGNSVRTATSGVDEHALSNTVGPVLDPIVSLRRRIRLRPGKTARLCFSTVVAPSREAVIGLADKYHDATTFERVATLAWTQAQVQLHYLGVGPDEAHLFQHLAGSVLYSARTLRPALDVLMRAAGGAPLLWANGISGDIPIVVVQIDDAEQVGIVRQLLRAHEYWRMKRLAVDLVILNDRAPSYVQDLQSLLQTLVRASQSTVLHHGDDTRGKVFVLRADQLTPAQRDVLLTAARAVLSSRGGTLTEQIARGHRADAVPPATPRRRIAARPAASVPVARPTLEFFNGTGGFDADGKEYVTILGKGASTPAPWINVIANEDFGCLVSESGSGFTWSLNSQENQLTPWSNDPVGDAPGEILYVRDDETGVIWGATALPVREESGPYVVRHGHGYSRFEHDANGIALDLLQFVALDDPVKISRLTLSNHSGRPRRLSVTAYVEWVLGTSRSGAAPYVITQVDAATGAVFARNPWNTDFASRVAFVDLGGKQTSVTGDRREFLGRNGTSAHPAALERREPLSGRVGPALDPCGALQTMVEIPDGGQAEVVLFLGQAATSAAAATLIHRFRGTNLNEHHRQVLARWDDMLGVVQVKTPDRSLDVMVNRWLLYQTLACRVWARSAFYQSSGAFGFRDQLQDVMALAVARPDLARKHILRAAARQFGEGDVQHWWHEPAGRGIRTRFSDDLLWLPYVATRYMRTTGDERILDEIVPFLEGPTLAAGQLTSYFEPGTAGGQATLFEHGARALDRSLVVGSHGLPLMGIGDWNDGMNYVGAGGKGESVWLGWFLCSILGDWATLAEARGEAARAAAWRDHLAKLKTSLEESGWDGEWYRRAYFDDGTPLGSRLNDECRIDSIAQSWSVMSGAAEPERQRRAMDAVDEQLIRREDRLLLLLTPPFDRSSLEPGYIKGYLPGIRENGAQYTHAATWTVVAFAMLGEGDKAAELLAMLNPIAHTSTGRDVERYQVEPYVVAADVYSQAPHVGRGGWTWYTGSAGWLYTAALEWILGFRLRGSRLLIDPCIPRGWSEFSIDYRHRSARYSITVENPRGVSRGVSHVTIDDAELEDVASIPLVDDGQMHRVRVVLG